MAVDARAACLVADATGQGVFVYRALTPTAASASTTSASSAAEGVADGPFEFPNGVAVDARGRVYVADTFNDRVQIWSY